MCYIWALSKLQVIFLFYIIIKILCFSPRLYFIFKIIAFSRTFIPLFSCLWFQKKTKTNKPEDYHFISKFKQHFLINSLALTRLQGKSWLLWAIYSLNRYLLKLNILICLLSAYCVLAAILKQAEFSLLLSLCPSNL